MMYALTDRNPGANMKNKALAVVGLGVLLSIAPCVDAYGQEVEPQPCQGEVVGSTAEVTGDCILLAYRYADGAAGPNQLASSLPQTLVSRDDSSEDGHLSVEVPNCFWQIDLVQADANIAETLTVVDHYSSQGALVDAEHGGTSACETVIQTTTTTSTTIPETTTTSPATTTTVCNDEGAECWDCATMGNLLCATTTTVATPTTELARTGAADRLPIYSGLLALIGLAFILISTEIAHRRA